MEYSRRDKHGSYTLKVDNDLIQARFDGTCSATIWKAFNDSLTRAVGMMKGRQWGCFADLSNMLAWPKPVEKVLHDTYQICIENGCHVGAFIFGSAIAPSQLQNVEKEMGLCGRLRHQAFDSEQEALQYIDDTLRLFSPSLPTPHQA